jgi:hypothetical protein
MVMFAQVLLYQNLYIFTGFIISVFLFILRAKFENRKLSILSEYKTYVLRQRII